MKEMKIKLKKLLDMNKNCSTCGNVFEAKRIDSKYCSRLCYRRNPEVATVYSQRTNAYQKAHAREVPRRFQKLKYKCNYECRSLSISLEEYTTLLVLNCAYCNKDFKNESGCGLDRVDSNGHYSLDNVVPCCGSCNQIKNVHLTYNEMKVAMAA